MAGYYIRTLVSRAVFTTFNGYHFNVDGDGEIIYTRTARRGTESNVAQKHWQYRYCFVLLL